MADPFEDLRLPDIPVDPDPAFAERLQARLLRTFDLPQGVTVSDLTIEETHPPAAPPPEPEPVRGPVAVLPYLAVAGAREAIEWYQEALGARLRGSPIVMPDGRVGHAELEIGDGGVIMLAEEHPEIGVAAPAPGAPVPVTIHASVADVDRFIDRAIAAGAGLERAVADYDYGRNGVIRDPFGHRWLVSGESPGVRHGDVGYASLWVPDADRAARFYSEVLGWRCEPNQRGEGWAVTGLSLHHGIHGGHTQPGLFLSYAVSDLTAAVDAVRRSGGTASEPVDEPWGRTAMCADVSGLPFAVYSPPAGVSGGDGPGRPANGRLPGDLAYITMHTGDSASARDFYTSVLGWGWQPGRVDDGWTAQDPVPMTGVAGGQERIFVIPMYRVDDVTEAVARVRALGGTATEPDPQPYGITADCEDDQGTRFYLGQL